MADLPPSVRERKPGKARVFSGVTLVNLRTELYLQPKELPEIGPSTVWACIGIHVVGLLRGDVYAHI